MGALQCVKSGRNQSGVWEHESSLIAKLVKLAAILFVGLQYLWLRVKFFSVQYTVGQLLQCKIWP